MHQWVKESSSYAAIQIDHQNLQKLHFHHPEGSCEGQTDLV